MEEIKIFKNLYLWLIVVVLAISTITWVATRSVQVVDTGLIRYQEFQEIYNTTKQINDNICNLIVLKDDDKMFKDFSKSQQVLALKSNMNRWIAEYNAKSSLINFSVWKSDTLPQVLNVNQFSCL